MQKINIDLFLKLNADANSPHWAELLARTTAGTPVAITAAILVGLWIWGKPTRRGPLLAVMAGLAIAFLLASPFAFLLYTPRPFVLGVGHTLIPHAPETSFPGDHALLIWSVAFGLLTTGAGRAWGWMLVILGFSYCLGAYLSRRPLSVRYGRFFCYSPFRRCRSSASLNSHRTPITTSCRNVLRNNTAAV